VRNATAVVMGRRRDRPSVPILLERVDGPDPGQRPAALVALGRIGDPQAEETLVRAAEDPAHSIRVCALHALGEMRAPRAHDVALRRVADRSYAVRGAAAICLGEVGTPVDLPILFRLLEDTHPWPRSAAIYAIGRLGCIEAVPRVREELAHAAPEVRLAAIWTLGRLRDDASRAELVRLLEADEARLAAPAPDAEGHAAVQRTKDAEDRIFDTVVQALGRLRHPEDDPFVEEALWGARARFSEEALDRVARLPRAEVEGTPHLPTLRDLFDVALPDGPDVEGG
ncbi:MAG: HEAT repeat domain-containing protein, partial [Thermoplasmata archaeon]